MFRILQASVLVAMTLVVANESEAKTRGASKGTGISKSTKGLGEGKTGSMGNNKTNIATTKDPVHGPGSSHNPKGPITKDPVHGPGSSHDPKGPTKTHPTRTHHRDFRNWGHRYFNSSYGCEFFRSDVYGCYFYFYAPASRYYPVTCIEQFPPVRTAVAPVAAAPVAPVTPVVPAIQIVNDNRNTLINGVASLPVEPGR